MLGEVADTPEGRPRIQNDLDWRNGKQSTGSNSTRTGTKTCTWDGIIECKNTDWGITG